MAEQTTTIPKKWKETSLGDVVEIIDGDRGLNYPKNDEFFSDGYCLFLNTKNVPNDSFSFQERMFIDKWKDGKLRKGKLKRGDFVLTTRGTVGNFAFYSEKIPFDNIRINSGMVILRTKDEVLSKSYLNFYLKSYFFNDQVLSLSSGTAQPQLPIRDLTVFQIYLPALPEQQAIAAVLSSLDNKIELLREQNKTLEATAQAIYKEWFVNFNFPNGKGKPYKKSGGKMVDSELGKIPERWRVGQLIEGEISEFVKANIDQFDGMKDYIETANVNLSNFAGSFEKISYNGRPSRANMQPVANSIWFARMAESRKYLLFQERDKENINTKILSTGFAGIRCVKDYLYFYWCFILSDILNDLKNQYAEGAVQVAISNGGIQRITLVLPPKEIAKKFTETVGFCFEKISNNNSQIQTLSILRDALLPKLMSGKLRVKNYG